MKNFLLLFLASFSLVACSNMYKEKTNGHSHSENQELHQKGVGAEKNVSRHVNNVASEAARRASAASWK